MITHEIPPSRINFSTPRPVVDVIPLIKLKLLPLSRTAFQVSELLRNPYVTTRRLAAAVALDPVFAERLLKMANSSLFPRKKESTSIHQAIEEIGVKSFYDIVMIAALAEGFAREIGTIEPARVVWEHSLAVALLARELSESLRLRDTEEAFICGLLHDVGKLMLLRVSRESFAPLLEDKTEPEMLEAESALFGLTHSEAGAFVTRKWQLPAIVSEVVAHHHQLPPAGQSTVVAQLVNVADQYVNAQGRGVRSLSEEAVFQSPACAALNLDRARIATAWNLIQTPLNELAEAFG